MLEVVELLAEVSNVDLDVVLVAEEVEPPDLVKDALTGQHLVGVDGQVQEQIELPCAETDPPVAAVTTPLLPSVDAELGLAPCATRPDTATQHGVDAREQLAEVEGLDKVIVRAELETLDAVAGLVTRAEDDDAAVLVAGDGTFGTSPSRPCAASSGRRSPGAA